MKNIVDVKMRSVLGWQYTEKVDSGGLCLWVSESKMFGWKEPSGHFLTSVPITVAVDMCEFPSLVKIDSDRNFICGQCHMSEVA